jgi:hypothetical protein
MKRYKVELRARKYVKVEEKEKEGVKGRGGVGVTKAQRWSEKRAASGER